MVSPGDPIRAGQKIADVGAEDLGRRDPTQASAEWFRAVTDTAIENRRLKENHDG